MSGEYRKSLKCLHLKADSQFPLVSASTSDMPHKHAQGHLYLASPSISIPGLQRLTESSATVSSDGQVLQHVSAFPEQPELLWAPGIFGCNTRMSRNTSCRALPDSHIPNSTVILHASCCLFFLNKSSKQHL